ncbi:hypothetical protein ACMD2_17334, partial [Ananas comosus]
CSPGKGCLIAWKNVGRNKKEGGLGILNLTAFFHWWKGVLSLSDIFKWGIYYKLGNGCTIDFLSDRWSMVSSLKLDFPEVYNMTECKTLKVKDCLTSDSWNWSKILGGDSVNKQESDLYFQNSAEPRQDSLALEPRWAIHGKVGLFCTKRWGYEGCPSNQVMETSNTPKSESILLARPKKEAS